MARASSGSVISPSIGVSPMVHIVYGMPSIAIGWARQPTTSV